MTRLGSNGSSVPAISMFMLSHRQQSSNLIVNMETTKKWNSDIYSNAEDCNDIMTCLLTDGNDIVRLLGFAPISNTNRALVILTCALIGLFLLEFALLSHQCAARKRKTNDRKTCLQRLAICLARRN
jgi:hypothetical protein